MTPFALMRRIGLGGIGLVVVFVFGKVLWREAGRSARSGSDGVTVRFAHRLLDDQTRGAFDVVAREFERLQAAGGRKVRVEQVDIPERSYRQWLRTQLIGETAPELMMIETNGYEDLLLGRYFVPLGDVIEQPNPYNAGTKFEGVRWRETILDGMLTSGFNFRIVQHFGVPFVTQTNRIFANRTLLEKILAEPGNAALRGRLGARLAPQTFEDFHAICEAALAYARAHNLDLAPLVDVQTSFASPLFDQLYGSQSMAVYESDWDIDHAHRTLGGQTLVAYATGRRSLNSPPVRSGFALMREFSRFMPVGFNQLQRDDVAFLYAQQRALMVGGSSNDAALFEAFVNDEFEQIVFPVPAPTPGTPVYGKFSRGQMMEDRRSVQACFGLVNLATGERRQVALEFLQYMTSLPGNTLLSRLSGRPPSVVDVPVSPEIAPYVPIMRGYSDGPFPHYSVPDWRNVLRSHYHLLFDPNGSVDEFIAATDKPFQTAAVPALRQFVRGVRQNCSRLDSLIAAQQWLTRHETEKREFRKEQLEFLVDAQDYNEDEFMFYRDWMEPVRKQIGL